MEIKHIEFDDKDDPESSCNQKRTRITIAPEGLVVALPNGGSLGKEDQVVLGSMLRLAYEQGKRVGALVEKEEQLCERIKD
jgi:hypothetical protein